ncbi:MULTISPECIES: LytR/AlgR family response regulator transcription factor [unclassified Polaribacter]|uniref:LytR/AlgR family response regulator transcription factor n=1 Tax=unclassified Polaribacter TaxID=196858 RepID=UPI0011BD6D3A|nr:MULTISPECIES: LytTR family DNA-binding domain-containing protein [unclassified Polaribacter]TXD51633.1 response regulator transcription factor [Polaribacter sp. IC063]TXD58793.1 response regulator transcription factor [Polaribacter sp. IC066]
MRNKLKCVVVDDEPMAREIIETYIAKTPNLELIASCKNAGEAILLAQENEVDLFFLDIHMPEISGLSLAKIIHKKSQIIFTTAYRAYAIDGFNLNVVDYLLKPIAFDRFLQAVQKVVVSEISENKNDFMFVRSDRKMVKIDFNSILYLESLSDYLKIFTAEKTIVIRETISSLEEKLPPKNFIRIHRSFIVSLKNISSYTNEFIEINQKALPISRSYKESVLQKLAKV